MTASAAERAAAERLATTVLASMDPFTLDLPNGVTADQAKRRIEPLGTDDAWRAYDLLHQLDVFGRAF